jgi:hypothetical protein
MTITQLEMPKSQVQMAYTWNQMSHPDTKKHFVVLSSSAMTRNIKLAQNLQ